MLLSNYNFLKRANLKLVSKIFPVKRPEILLLDKLEINLKGTKINQINIPSISFPQTTGDLCPVKPKVIEQKTVPSYFQVIICQNAQCLHKLRIQIDEQSIGKQLKIICPICGHTFVHSLTKDKLIHDFSTWLREQLFYPEIESFPLLSNLPRKAGKSYKQIQAEIRQLPLFDFEEEDKNCIHGLKKSWCSICIQKEKQHRAKAVSCVDPFDLIFPILQPPLGESFDNPIVFPLGMELYPFQRVGIKFLVDHERALLGDEMGLGKSIQAIVAIRFLFRMGKVSNGLMLCPRSVLTDWEKKLWDWAPELRVVKVRGVKEQRQIFWNSPTHIYLTTYETLRQDLSASVKGNKRQNLLSPVEENHEEKEVADIARKQFDFILLDEIQKIKNPGASITKATRLVDARFRWGLSGTPLENRLEELLSIFAYLKPGLLHYNDATRPRKVKEAIKPYFLRRRKADALPELPEKIHEDVWLELSPAQRKAYDRAERESIVALNEQGDSVTVQHILALITKLKQICNMDPISKESCKLEYLLEKLEEISEQGDKTLVFSQYPNKTLRFLEPMLKQFSPFVYDGSLSDSQRDWIVTSFQEREGSKVLLMSVKTGGLGLTLTRASHVYHFDLWWNPSVAAQAEDRTHRIGQKKRVFVTSLFTRDTIEERIQDLLKRKRELFKTVIDDLSDTNLSKGLTERELFSLFGLEGVKETKREITPRAKSTVELLEQISAQQFEQLVADLYEKMGYQVRITSQTKDQGIDVFAKRISESGTESLAIQCKHYLKGVVGVEHARSLYGVIQDQPGIAKGILVTSGEFSRECEDFTKGKRLELFDGHYVCALLEKYGTSLFERTK